MSDGNEQLVEVYFKEDGTVSGVHVRLDVDAHLGPPIWLEFDGSKVSMFALYPEDANTVSDDFTAISIVRFPEKPDDA